MNNPTTPCFPRTMRQSGSQYAASIERTRRHDASGKLIVVMVFVIVAFISVVLS